MSSAEQNMTKSRRQPRGGDPEGANRRISPPPGRRGPSLPNPLSLRSFPARLHELVSQGRLQADEDWAGIVSLRSDAVLGPA